MPLPFKNQVRIEKSGPDSFSDCHLNKFVDSQDILIKSVVSRPPFDGVTGILSDPVSFFPLRKIPHTLTPETFSLPTVTVI